MMTPRDISRLRLLRQHIGDQRSLAVKNLVSRMGAMQAQDYAMVKWAVGVRIPGITEKTVEDAIDQGEVIRTHLLRPTWHMVSSADIYWILELTAPHIRRSLTSRHKELEITNEILFKSFDLIVEALSDNKHLTREELVNTFEEAGIGTGDNRAAHLLLCAELDGLICSGSSRGKLPTYALLAERVPRQNTCSRDESLARLAGIYFASHGPATLPDFVWWSGLPVAEARRALEMVNHDLHAINLNGETYWLADPLSLPPLKEPEIYLLPAFDEFLIGYRDRSASLARKNHKEAVSSNGIFRPVIVLDGRIVGVWKRILKGDSVILETDYFNRSSKSFNHLVKNAATRFGIFLGRKAEVK